MRRTLTITVLAPTRAQPALHVTPTVLNFDVVEGDKNPAPASLVVSNAGGGRLVWSVSNDSPKWLTLDPTKGALAGASAAKIQAQPISSGLAAGRYPATLTFTTPGAVNTSVVVTATLVVTPSPSATNSVVTGAVSPGPSRFLLWGIPAAVVLVGGLMLARKTPKKKRPQPVSPDVKLILGAGVQEVRAPEPLLSLFLRIRVRIDTGTQRVSAQARLIEKITKVE
jgi:hypothetical protein